MTKTIKINLPSFMKDWDADEIHKAVYFLIKNKSQKLGYRFSSWTKDGIRNYGLD